jgi:hydrogenase 3 maturation protease
MPQLPQKGAGKISLALPGNLKNLLSGNDKRILFVGIGNVLKQDDGVGVYISRRIRETGHIKALTAEVSIENYIGKINSLQPDILVLIDCVDLGLPPGSARLISAVKLMDITFNTHNISLKRLSEFFRAPVSVLGIQPGSIDFGEKISYIVKKEADKIISLINNQEENHGSRIFM